MLTKINRRELLSILVMGLVILMLSVQPLLVNAAVYKVSSKIERYKVSYLTQGYFEDSSQHFIYKYTESDKENIAMIKAECERSFNQLTAAFGYVPKEKLTIVIFPSTELMNTVLGIPQDQKAMGVYASGFISVLSPNVWINEKNSKKHEDTFKKTGPIAHELTHYFIDIRTKGNYPAWFTEGVALYYEKKLTGFEWGKGQRYNIRPYTVKELTDDFENLDSDYAYRRSYEIINQYIEKNGEDKLLNIMDKLGEGYALEDFGN